MFECYFVKLNIANNKHRKKVHNKVVKFFQQQQKYSLAQKKELRDLDKNVTPSYSNQTDWLELAIA